MGKISSLLSDRVSDRQPAYFFVFFRLLVRGCRHQSFEQGHYPSLGFLEKTFRFLEGYLPGRGKSGGLFKHDVEGRLVDEVLPYFLASGFLVEGLDGYPQVVTFLSEVVELVLPAFVIGGIDFEFGMEMAAEAVHFFRQFAPPEETADIDDEAEDQSEGQAIGERAAEKQCNQIAVIHRYLPPQPQWGVRDSGIFIIEHIDIVYAKYSFCVKLQAECIPAFIRLFAVMVGFVAPVSAIFVGKKFEIDPVPCPVDLQHGDPDDIPELIDFSAYLTAQAMMACIVEKIIPRYLPDGDGAADKKLQQFDVEKGVADPGDDRLKGFADMFFHEQQLEPVDHFTFGIDGGPFPA